MDACTSNHHTDLSKKTIPKPKTDDSSYPLPYLRLARFQAVRYVSLWHSKKYKNSLKYFIIITESIKIYGNSNNKAKNNNKKITHKLVSILCAVHLLPVARLTPYRSKYS